MRKLVIPLVILAAFGLSSCKPAEPRNPDQKNFADCLGSDEHKFGCR